ncbi:MAG: 5-formyltetrahydrofolate cyclo-ligase, partial [Actinomycetota bacterium]
VSGAENVLGFASFGTELPTDAVIAAILTAGKRLLLPYVDGEHLRAAEVRSVEDLAPGYRGIREPVARVPVELAEAGVVLVPGVAFDGRGNRLGYGGGFYDGLLSEITTRVPRIGVCFDLQVVDDVPAGDHDQPVDLVVTERRLIRCLEA